MTLFLILITVHGRYIEKIKLYRLLIEINVKSIARLNGEWTQFRDSAVEFIDTAHPFSYDLDLFGHGSLFQWINCAQTWYGRDILKKLFLQPGKNTEDIVNRQKAIVELSENIEWRQMLQAIGTSAKNPVKDPLEILEWAEEKKYIFSNDSAKAVTRILPLVTACAITLSAAVSSFPSLIALILIIIQSGMLLKGANKRKNIFAIAEKYSEILLQYSSMMRHIEQKKFSSPHLASLQKKLFSENSKLSATSSIQKLEQLTGLMKLRVSLLHAPVNIVTLWDLQCIISLEKWKKESGRHLREWLEIIGTFEALSSLSVISFDNPEWAFPSLTSDEYQVTAVNAAHPLIHASSRVANNVSLLDRGSIILITGSNMSGKSTMLRTVGINLVLAYAGAPVCADRFTCSVMDIYTSMRISDSLEKSISSFYAELIRVKMIVEASKTGKPMVFFLDEIFRGTNTRDRKYGAVTVLKNLAKKGIAGFISTHDVELAELEKDTSLSVKNHYFMETYEGDKIIFDYRMRDGISTTSDAVFLMKMIGLEIEE